MGLSSLIVIVSYLTFMISLLILMYVRNEETNTTPKERDNQRIVWLIITLIGLSTVYFIFNDAGT
jgi:amino acid transporter